MSVTTLEPRRVPLERWYRKCVAPIRHGAPHVLVIAVMVVGALFAHELGHALVAQFFGARIVMFNVLGMQWYPKLEWMPQLGFGGYVYWFAPVNGDEFYRTNHRLIVMAGSNFTMLLAVGAVLTLNVTRVRGIARTALAVMALYFLDSLIHAFPVLGIMPLSWNTRFTRTFSEAYFAAIGLGISHEFYLGALFALCILITLFLVRALRK